MNGLKNSIDNILSLLERSRLGQYAAERLPSDTDKQILQLTRVFREGSEEQRTLIRDQVTDEYTYGLLTFAKRMAVLTVRKEEVKWAKEGLLAVAIENFNLDQREDMPMLCLLNHSITKIGADPVAVFEEVARYAEPDVSETMMRYVKKKEREKSIAAMGYEEVSGADGFDYKRKW